LVLEVPTPGAALPSVNVDPATADELHRLAVKHSMTIASVIETLVEMYADDPSWSVGACEGQPGPVENSGLVAIHMSYLKFRTEAAFDPPSHRVQITSGPLSGHWFSTPSAAAVAVVSDANPTKSAARNGWETWTVSATGAKLQSIRRG
jgi:hypothetical protein